MGKREKQNIDQNPADHLSLRTKLTYGFGDAGCNFSWTLVGTVLMYYYTESVGLSMYTVSMLFLISRLWDAVNDPLIGALSDRTRTKWGVYRPWILFGSLFLAASNILVFTTIPGSVSAKFVYALITYSILVLAYTAVNIPYGSLLSRMTQNTDDRGQASGFRILFATVFGSLVSMLAMPLVAALGGDNPQKGYTLLAVICSVLLIPIFFTVFLNCKENVKIPERKIKEKFKLSSIFLVFKHNTPLIIVSVGMFVCGFLTNGRNAVLLYYFSYVGGGTDMMIPYMLVVMPFSIVGTILCPWISRKMGSKSRTMILICVCLFLGMLGMFFFSPDKSMFLFLLFTAIISIFTTGFASVSYGMIPDCIEYGQYINHVRADGVIYSMNSFVNKVGITLATSGLSLLLGFVGYVEGGVAQTGTVVKTINYSMTLIPGFICLLGAIPYFFYKLDRERFNEILGNLREREAEETAEGLFVEQE